MPNVLNENWRPIPGYEGSYSISDLGRIKSEARTITRKNGVKLIKRERILAPQKETSGHLRFYASMGSDGVKRISVHRAVMAAFHGPCPEGFEVCHADGDPTNNCYTNLRYDTRTANILDSKAHGTFSEAGIHPRALLTNEQAVEIYNTKGIPAKELASIYGVSFAVINQIWRGDGWASVTGGKNVSAERGGRTYYRTKLTTEQVEFAIANRANRTGVKDGRGLNPTAIAIGVDVDVIKALYAAIDAGKPIIYAK